MKRTDKNNSNATSAIKNSTNTQTQNSTDPKIIQLKKKYVTDEMPAELRKTLNDFSIEQIRAKAWGRS